MDMKALKRRLIALGQNPGPVDGACYPETRAAIHGALKEGPDWRLEASDVVEAAGRLSVDAAKIWAVWDVEANATAFIEGMPTILFEPHRFSRATAHRFDASHPAISSKAWNKKLYPGSQQGRWKQLLDAVALDVDAAFASASYGGFQILGENYMRCGAITPWAFAWKQAQTEADQLDAFCRFVDATGLKGALQRGDWAAFARGYNGTAYRANRYDERLAVAFAKRRGEA